MTYPAYNAIPEQQLMTACEALCWIGYKRAVPKDIYFSPVNKPGALNGRTQESDALIHAAVPDPKPLNSPMGAAEKDLMRELRAGTVRALCVDPKTNSRSELPTSDFDADVVVNVRGSLEPDNSSNMDRFLAARAQPSRGPLWFRTNEIVAKWPAENDAILVKSTFATDGVAGVLILPNKTGPKPEKCAVVVTAMISDFKANPALLASDTQENLANHYKTLAGGKLSRGTAEKARREALAQLPQNTDRTLNTNK